MMLSSKIGATPASPRSQYCMDCKKAPKDNRLIQAYLKTWKDVYEPNGIIKLSLPSLKVCSECLVGHSVPVLRPSTFQWEIGNVHCYDECTDKHQFVFMDEEKEWIRVEDDPFRTYSQEFDEEIKPGPHLQVHTHNHHVNQSRPIAKSKKKKSAPKRPPTFLAPSITFKAKVTTLNADDMTVAVGHRKEDNNEDHQSATISPLKSPITRPPFSPLKVHTPRTSSSFKKKTAAPGTPSPERSQDSSMTRSTITCSLSSPPPSSVSDRGRLGSPASFGSPSRTQRLWTPDEDERLLATVQAYPSSKNPPWPKIAESIPGRTGKQCRERFKDHLDPNLRQAEWSQTEDAMIFRLFSAEGSKWSRMTRFLPGRTDNNIKNRYHHLRKRFEKRVHAISHSMDLERFMRKIALSRPFAGTVVDPLVLTDLAFRTLVAFKRRQVARYGMTDGDYKFGPFRLVSSPYEQLQCQRCGLILPSPQTGRYICTKTGWCQTCTMMTPVLTGDALRTIHIMAIQEEEQQQQQQQQQQQREQYLHHSQRRLA